ncbi:MAG TPA: hypothetical protein VFB06_28440 [Streptosporangiaceae bacterium]|nr:hypothetical protein [Streptosporangiaceae bacterium]
MARTVHSAALADGQHADTAYTLTGQVGAVQWNTDHTEIRLYCPTEGKTVQEYQWQGGAPWLRGLNEAGSSLNSRTAGAHWQKDGDHLRYFYQEDKSLLIKEMCYDTPDWSRGQTFTLGAFSGTSIAAFAMFDPSKKSAHLFLYYQTPQTSQPTSCQIVEQYWNGDTRSGWLASHAFPGALPGTGIAAVYFIDGSNKPHKRVYYQDAASNLIVEQCWDGGDPNQWAQGRTFTGALKNTPIAATHWWHDGSHVRLYYKTDSNTIVERCYDTERWSDGHTFTDAASGTGIAAVGWDDSGNQVRVYYEDTTNAVIEQCYDHGEWARGTFIAPAAASTD